MNLSRKELEVRLELLASLARSQQAVARILNSVADEANRAPNLAHAIQRNMTRLEAMQLTLTAMAGALERSQSRGRRGFALPSEPWLHPAAAIGAHLKSN
ncbi:hypothetical protein [Paenibacillus montanisoli]|uniref:Uncharacterized protein n=1 Tax=Paenibacillus montanisoli TaxID=2081970 RepID=A0A328U3K6_9BACL|nr:hypothetical protein [Paenibacillus montanisoli]RAP77407.1 hypothetical protein DL346_02680 [Paenibacillus montanisoli]